MDNDGAEIGKVRDGFQPLGLPTTWKMADKRGGQEREERGDRPPYDDDDETGGRVGRERA